MRDYLETIDRTNNLFTSGTTMTIFYVKMVVINMEKMTEAIFVL